MRNSMGHMIHLFLPVLIVTSFGLVGALPDQRMTGFSHRTVLPLLLHLFTVTSTTTATTAAKFDCNDLPKTPEISHLINCENGGTFMTQDVDGVIDFSKATQQQMDTWFNNQNAERSIGSSFKLKNSAITKFIVKLQLQHDTKVEILNNDFLENLDFVSITGAKKTLSVKISGNRKLTAESIIKLNSTKRISFDYLQEFGECNAPTSVVSIKDLEGCGFVKGNLIVDKSTNMSYDLSSSLEIRGCIEVNGTDLDNVFFMKKLQAIGCTSSGHKITNNHKLCIHPEFEEDLQNTFAGIDLTGNLQCSGECTSEYLMLSKNDKCKIITDTLTLTGDLKDEDLQFLDSVTEIRGRLVIKRTDLGDFTILQNLEKIDAKDYVTESAIEVSNNPNLTSFSLPSLSAVETNEIQKVIYMLENGFVPNSTEIEEWENKYGKDKVQIIKPRPTINANATQINQTDTPTEHRKEKEEEGLHPGAIAGIAVAAGITLIALLTGLAVLLYFLLRPKARVFLSDKPFVENNFDRIRWPDPAPHYEIAKGIIMENNRLIEEQSAKFMTEIQKSPEDNVLRAMESVYKKHEGIQRSFSDVRILDPKQKKMNEETKAGVLRIRNAAMKTEQDIEDRLRRKLLRRKKMKHWTKESANTTFGDNTTNGDGQTGTSNQTDEKKPGEEEEEGDIFDEGDVVEDPDDYRQAAGKEEDDQKPEKELKLKEAPLYHSVRKPFYPFLNRRDSELRYYVPEDHFRKCECVDGDPADETKEARESYKTSIVGVRWDQMIDDELNIMKVLNKDHIHERFLKYVRYPIVYEQQFRYTARAMSEEPLRLQNSARDMYIEGDPEEKPAFGIDTIHWEFGFEERPRTDRPCGPIIPNSWILCVYEYQNELNDYYKMFSEITWRPRLNKGFDETYLKAVIDALIASPPGDTVLLTAQDILQICSMAKEELQKWTSAVATLHDKVPIRVIGEIRGRFKDLRKTINLPSPQCRDLLTHPILYYRHVFLGNYIGGGQFNIDTIAFVFALQAVLKDRCVLLRGAMEWRQMNKTGNFFLDLQARFPNEYQEVYNAINEVFDYMPLACKIGEKIMCTHGGISPNMELLENVKLPITELVPDTLPFNMTFARPNITVKRYFDNVDARAGYYFGEMVFHENVRMSFVEAMIVAMPLRSGWGLFCHTLKLYGLSSAMMLEDTGDHDDEAWAALAEIDGQGAIVFRVYYMEDTVTPKQEKAMLLNPKKKVKKQTTGSKESASKETAGASKETAGASKETAGTAPTTPAAQDTKTPNKT